MSFFQSQKRYFLDSSTTYTHILVVITVIDSYSGVWTVKDALLLTDTFQLIQPDPSSSCSRHTADTSKRYWRFGEVWCKCIVCGQIQHLRWLWTPDLTSGSPASYTPPSHPRCQSDHHTPFPRHPDATPPVFHEWVIQLNAPQLYNTRTNTWWQFTHMQFKQLTYTENNYL